MRLQPSSALVFLLLLSSQLAWCDQKIGIPSICIIPIGKYNKGILDCVCKGISYFYGISAKVLDDAIMPSRAWYEPRKRYRAEVILDFLNEIGSLHPECNILLGFTSHDISTTKGENYDYGIFGLGEVNGKSAVVSSYRLTRNVGKDKGIRRVIKVVNHEIGHVLGLHHCPIKGCNMNDAKGTIVTVDKESGVLCSLCRKKVQEKYGITPPSKVDWDMIIQTP